MTEFVFPTVKGDVRTVNSFSDPGVTYKVDLHKATCTCPDFVDRRSEHPVGNRQRLCKHLRHEYATLPEFKNQPVFAVMNDNYSCRHYAEFPEIPAIIGYTKGKEWVNVFARSKSGPYERFGYSLDEERWAYEKTPKEKKAILKVIDKNRDAFELTEGRGIPIDIDDDLKPILTEFYELANSIVEDDQISAAEMEELSGFLVKHKTIIMVGPIRSFVELVIDVTSDGHLTQSEHDQVVGALKSIGKAIY